jgi:lambda family phage minor tail protein L
MADEPIETAVQRAAPGAPVDLFILDLTSLGGGLEYFTTEIWPDGQQVVFGGITYRQIAVEFSGVKKDGKGPFPNPQFRISNVQSEAISLMEEFDDLIGARITHIQTFARHLDDGDDPDDQIWIQKNVFDVDRLTEEGETHVAWELAAAIDQRGRKYPRGQVLRSCSAEYRTFDTASGQFRYAQTRRQCPYRGDNCFDRFGNPVDAANDDCSHDGSGCTARFGQFAPIPMHGALAVGLSR